MVIDHNWMLKSGNSGKGLKKHPAVEPWAELKRSYVGAEPEENWEALFGTVALFRRTAVEVTDQLGFTYPDGLDGRVVDSLRRIRSAYSQWLCGLTPFGDHLLGMAR